MEDSEQKRVKVGTKIGEAVLKRLDDYCTANGRLKSFVIETAIDEHLRKLKK